MVEKICIFDLINRKECERIRAFSWDVTPAFSQGAFLHEGDDLCEISFGYIGIDKPQTPNLRIKVKESGFYMALISAETIIERVSGFYVSDSAIDESDFRQRSWFAERNMNSVIFLKSNSIKELCDEKYSQYGISTDPFKKTRSLQWENKFLLVEDSYRPRHFIEFLGDCDNAFLKFYYCDTRSIIKNRSISLMHFLFEDNSVLTLAVDKKIVEYRDKDNSVFKFRLSEADLRSLSNNVVKVIRFETLSGEHLNTSIEKMPAEVFRCIAGRFSLLLTECGFEFSKLQSVTKVAADSKDTTPILSSEDTCYVYLMLDEANGFHKIGISNHPEYRERTLQSEKPTITMLCAKEYPTRVIAEAIESALHKAFGNKRVRGEWFKLDAIDVASLRATLS